MDEKFVVDQAVFYITNVCNLTCKSCETFNNRKFKGHFYWQDHKDEYVQWSKQLDINFITIIGGEPFANPALGEWVIEIKKHWPNNNNFNICTNGTYLKDNIKLAREIIQQGVWLDISIHDPAFYQDIQSNLEHALEVFDYTLNQKSTTLEYYVADRLVARLYTAYTFQQSSQKYLRNGVTYMHRSDINKAHELCIGKLGHCHFFVKGLLYKCYLTAVSQDFTEQFALEETAKELLSSYKACSPWHSRQQLGSFFETVKNPIPQCTLCPENVISFPIWPINRKK
jgi:organic radical activating enzyme